MRIRKQNNSEEYTEVGGRCKSALFLHRHRAVYKKGYGYRCKYCGRPFFTLREEHERKMRNKALR